MGKEAYFGAMFLLGLLIFTLGLKFWRSITTVCGFIAPEGVSCSTSLITLPFALVVLVGVGTMLYSMAKIVPLVRSI